MVLIVDNENNLIKILNSHAIKPSHPRLKVFSYLRQNKNHPTADQIYTALLEKMPTLSKMTVYNTLKLLADRGLITVINTDKEAKFDAETKEHGHFICRICQKIYDVELGAEILENDSLQDYFVEKTDVFYRGICPGCQAAAAADK